MLSDRDRSERAAAAEDLGSWMGFESDLAAHNSNASRIEVDQDKRRTILLDIQRVLNEELPYLHLWYYDNVVVHTARLSGIQPSPGGDYDFLKTAVVH